jgi:Tol biopolymer transport system component
VADAAGGQWKDLGFGQQPSWSPDGKYIAFMDVGPGFRGLGIIGVDGGDAEYPLPDATWVKWSPRADEFACSTGVDLWLYDRKTKKRSMVIEGGYERVSNGFNWSPDGQWICFKGKPKNEDFHTAVIHREGKQMGFRVLLPTAAMPNIVDFDCNYSWRKPDGKRILLGMTTQENSNKQLYLLDPEGKLPPELIRGQDPKQSGSMGTWSPDGKRIVFGVRCQ